MSRDADTLRRIEQLEDRLTRLELHSLSAEKLAVYREAESAAVVADGVKRTAEWREAVWPMLTPAEKLKVEKAQPGEAVEVAR